MPVPFPSPRKAGRLAALFLLVQAGLILTTYQVLSSAINWPASLDDPAAITLPRLIVQAGPVMLGYGCYLASALLIIPATAALNLRLGLRGTMGTLALSLATFSAMAKAIGICRWLFAMPGLAQAFVAPGADQTTIALVFETLNAYAGGIGEIIGVGLVSGVWTLVIGLAVWRDRTSLARPLAIFLILSGLGLFLTIPSGFGVELGPVLTLSNFAWQFSLIGLGLWALISRPKPLSK